MHVSIVSFWTNWIESLRLQVQSDWGTSILTEFKASLNCSVKVQNLIAIKIKIISTDRNPPNLRIFYYRLLRYCEISQMIF